MSSTTRRACPICGKTESLKHCASCKRVSYCSHEHQRQHWKVHRAACTHRPKQSKSENPSPSASNMVVVVEIKSGQGDGLANPMVKHLFDSLIEAKSYIQERLGYARLEEMKELTEMPFLTKFMKFSSASLFVDPRCNAFTPLADELIHQRLQPLLQELQRSQIIPLDEEENGKYHCYGTDGASEMNAMVIFFGCNIADGLTRFLNARGDAFFIGATAEHQPVTSNILYGAAHFLRDAMACFSDDEMTEEKRNEIFAMWSSQYSRGAWQPASGNGGVDLYDTNPFRCVVGWPVVDHRGGKNFQ